MTTTKTSHALTHSRTTPRGKRRGVGETAGSAAAECAAVCCCCPCTVVHVVVLAVYSVPIALFRKAVHRRRRRLMKNNNVNVKKNNVNNDVVLLQSQRSSSFCGNDMKIDSLEEHFVKERAAEEKSEEVALEKEMWARFAGTGFWRSDSQRQPWVSWTGEPNRTGETVVYKKDRLFRQKMRSLIKANATCWWLRKYLEFVYLD